MAVSKIAHGAALAALASTASAALMIDNWCKAGASVVLSHNGGCDYGTSGACITNGGKPWNIPTNTTTGFPWIADGEGTSVKISKDNQAGDGILQYEYTLASGEYGGLYWDLSDLDGSGPGLVGTPYAANNVKVQPTGDGAGQGTCLVIRCAANQTCEDAYQQPDDHDTRWCPADTGDMYLDLCEPEARFEQRRRVRRDDQSLHPVTMAVLPTPPATTSNSTTGPSIPAMVLNYFLNHQTTSSASKMARAFIA